jgi:hypothetical protein
MSRFFFSVDAKFGGKVEREHELTFGNSAELMAARKIALKVTHKHKSCPTMLHGRVH